MGEIRLERVERKGQNFETGEELVLNSCLAVSPPGTEAGARIQWMEMGPVRTRGVEGVAEVRETIRNHTAAKVS